MALRLLSNAGSTNEGKLGVVRAGGRSEPRCMTGLQAASYESKTV